MADYEDVYAPDLTEETESTLSGSEQFVMFDSVEGKRAELSTIADYIVENGEIDGSDIPTIVSTIEGNIGTVDTKVGDLTDLETTDKTSIVSAVNEVNGKAEDADEKADTVDEHVGDLSELETEDKTSAVGAINELKTGEDNLKEDLQDKADQNGIYPDLSAGNITGDFHIDTKPYLYRALRDVASHIGGKAFDTLVGGSVAVNQLIENGNFADTSKWWASYGSFTISNNVASFLTTAQYGQLIHNALSLISGHKYFFSVDLKGSSGTSTIRTYFASALSGKTVSVGDTWQTVTFIQSSAETANKVLYIQNNDASDWKTISVRNVVLIDLTQLFASDPSIADRAYALEQNTAGSGIAWLKSYGYIRDGYIPYNQGTLQSVKTTAHVTRDADDTIINNYPLDNIELRGVAKLVNNEIKYDGDVYEAGGTVTRNYGYRAYEAGDESLANAITDGTHTVYKLNTPTTETADPFTSPQTVYADGTEEYIDTRTVPIPVGHETKYELDLAEKLIGLPWDLSMLAPIENGTTASQAYAAGKYFVRNNEFCKAKTSIASGATFTLGTNYEVTTVGAEIFALA